VAERLRRDLQAFTMLAAMWVRVSWSYRASFVMMTVGSLVLTGIDFVAILVMFANVDSLGGFGLGEIAFLYGGTAICLGIADLVVGNVERLGQRVRMGSLDAMMVRPVGLLVQVCADEFAVRRAARITQALVVLSVACFWVSWSPAKVGLTIVMLVSGAVIFLSIFVVFGCIQFWTLDASEVANAFTYGGNTMTQYPLTIFPREVVTALTFLVPLAFVNWYPALYVLDRSDPYGFPEWLRFASPLAAAVLVAVTAVVWRLGVRHYESTGS